MRFFTEKKTSCLFLLLAMSLMASAQREKGISVAFVNNASGYPFSQFGNLVTKIQHPGVELGGGFNWKTKSKHDWYQEFKLSWFYHRFVQNAIMLYSDFGYRYKFSPHWVAQTAIGLGYLHSIPATAKLKLNQNGEYKNDKGIGMAQGMAAFNLGLGYFIHPSGKRPVKIFATYQQFLQSPFVKEYVPILPYNSLHIGCSIPIPSHKK